MQPLRLAAIAIALSLPTTLLAQSKNLLFYGNSFSFYNGGVAQIVRALAIEAGRPSPTIQEQLVSGQDLHFHATDPAQIAAISTSLPPGQTWDHVIIQGLSTEATQAIGNPTQFIADAITILGNVRNHSPAVTAVMYQTWARAYGHSYYPGTFANPLAMHAQIRAGYRNAIPALTTAFGSGAAVNSAVGDAVALLEFNPAFYDSDLHHPNQRMTLLAAMCLYTSLYGQLVCEITPDLSLPNPLHTVFMNYNLNISEWWLLAGIADRAAPAALRRYPGSSDNLLLETSATPGQLSACPDNRITLGTPVSVRISSRNHIYDNAPTWMLIDLFPTGQPPVPTALFPEIAVDLNTFGILLTAPNLGSALQVSVQMPFSFPGLSLMVQGLAWAPSAETGNAQFTTTDGHELMFY